tara:strand:- start:411 stop:572 length:162 start_codon:yes stop_codon:yes gene_type:complete
MSTPGNEELLENLYNETMSFFDIAESFIEKYKYEEAQKEAALLARERFWEKES